MYLLESVCRRLNRVFTSMILTIEKVNYKRLLVSYWASCCLVNGGGLAEK